MYERTWATPEQIIEAEVQEDSVFAIIKDVLVLTKIVVITTLLVFAVIKYYKKQRGHNRYTVLLAYKIFCVSFQMFANVILDDWNSDL